MRFARNKRFIIIATILLFTTALGTAAAAILYGRNADYQSINMEPCSDEDLLGLIERVEIEPLDVIEESSAQLPVLTQQVRLPVVDPITLFGAPLPKKYMNYKTSNQGIRDAIAATDTGGIGTSGKWHNGWDIACPDKTPVYAAKEGYVTEVWPSYYNGPYSYKGHPAYGGLIVIKHPDSTISLYAHLSMTEVKEGAYVERGQEIGWSGGAKGRRGSGTSTGPHLHFSIYVDMDAFMSF